MSAILAPVRSATQLAQTLFSRRKLLVIWSHTGRLTGNALGLALAAQSSSDFLPIFLGERSTSLGFDIPTWRKQVIAARLLKRAAVFAYTARPPAVLGSALASSQLLHVFLWHGMPIKGIGKFDPLTADRGTEQCDLAIATSERTAEMMAQSFGIAPEKFLISGEPKTDYLPTNRPGWDWSASLRTQYRILIGYFPTWREKFIVADGGQRRGDDAALVRLVSQLADDTLLRNLLARHKAAFVARTHVVHKKVMALSPPFLHMDDTQGDATHLLQECDAIVGDYSSLVIDALLFDRPLALWCEDFESYTSQRPLPYFDFHDTFGWAVKSGLPELRDWIEERLQSSPPTPAEVHGFTRCRAMFHQHARGGSGERVLEAVRARLKGPHPAE